MADGRYTPGGGYEFFHKDHLGNVRVSFNGSGTTQYTDYDPSGWQLPGLTGGSGSNRLKYNGKEAVGELGSNVLDYGARFYDATIGRWGVVDPLAEVSRRFSPYVYGNANPANMIDPDGMISQNASVYYQGQDARDYFAQILRQQGLSEQEGQGDGGPGPKRPATTTPSPKSGTVAPLTLGTTGVAEGVTATTLEEIIAGFGNIAARTSIFLSLAFGLQGDVATPATKPADDTPIAYIDGMNVTSRSSFTRLRCHHDEEYP